MQCHRNPPGTRNPGIPKSKWRDALEILLVSAQHYGMEIETILAWVGIALTVVFGVLALFFAPKIKRMIRTQRQKIGANGVGIQSGRDTKIGKID